MATAAATKRAVEVLVFEGFEILDVMGPIELFGMFPEVFDVQLVAEGSGPIASTQGPRVCVDRELSDTANDGIVLVPGGRGTRREVGNAALLEWISRAANTAEYLTSVCTGSALLAKAGVLDGKRATSNKLSLDWVISQGPSVTWVKEARWVRDGKFVTSSGVSAGMDMTLDIIASILGEEAADEAALRAEYTWHRDANIDPFAAAHRKGGR